MRLCTENEEKLLLILRCLTSGNSFVDLHHVFRIGVATVREIVGKVCVSIWELQIATEFEPMADFPNCLGTVGGKHKRILDVSQSIRLE
ncbi:uncharacterized protein LOC117218767 isoform X2 [Megalopta genalis]|uniref:uncharacterized protein LOC117218767 isoform X2 n=1 Tax=Megalopta genalis TaxID=115081 RepID=UPI003FCF07AD